MKLFEFLEKKISIRNKNYSLLLYFTMRKKISKNALFSYNYKTIIFEWA